MSLGFKRLNTHTLVPLRHGQYVQFKSQRHWRVIIIIIIIITIILQYFDVNRSATEGLLLLLLLLLLFYNISTYSELILSSAFPLMVHAVISSKQTTQTGLRSSFEVLQHCPKKLRESKKFFFLSFTLTEGQ